MASEGGGRRGDGRTGTPRHPGRGDGRALGHPKGRQVAPTALAEVKALLGDSPRRGDLLIEYLHRLQDAHGHLAHRHLVALASELRLALAEIYEVATFYHNFEVAPDDAPPPPVTIKLCESLSCALAGTERLAEALRAAPPGGARVAFAACLGRCDQAPVARIGHRFVTGATVARIEAALRLPDQPAIPAYTDFAAYRASGGYQLCAELHSGRRSVEEILAALEQAGLRGLGGAGFPTARKWRLVRQQPGVRLLAVNADESEPGTFKDRHFLLRDPHRFLDGMLIAAFAIEAADAYIYLRDEYPDVRVILQRELAKLSTLGLALPAVHVRRGAGAYICGEESAMLESLEGKRGLPRNKPPYPAEVGLFGRPTLINNVETLYWVRELVERGPAWFNQQGRRGRNGLRAFSVSGRVREPGVKLAPAGISAAELIAEHCGGMAEGHIFKGYLPGGASGGMLPASMADLPLDFGTLEPHGCLIGSAAIIVLSEADDACAAALNLMRFFADESCGQCTPCRVGTEKAVALMRQQRWDQPLLSELSHCMTQASICGLGQAAPNALLTALRYFPADVAKRS
ncbi:MAG: NADH-quinone oxidoreductase subunit F [Alphaproteobacteria bacterium]|nr:NADH-quinone oxidoreductase subunit F [Alphaproteobacteria bacterium]